LTARDPIKLRDAPARFLKTDWLRLMELKGSDAKAVETLSHPDPGMLVYYRRQVIAAGRGGPEALAAEDIYALVEKMIASLQEPWVKSSATGSIRGRACANPYHRSSGRT
jgi:predicted RNase H-like nuclease